MLERGLGASPVRGPALVGHGHEQNPTGAEDAKMSLDRAERAPGVLEEVVRDHEVHGRVGEALEALAVVDHVDRRERLAGDPGVQRSERGQVEAIDITDRGARGQRERLIERSDLDSRAADVAPRQHTPLAAKPGPESELAPQPTGDRSPTLREPLDERGHRRQCSREAAPGQVASGTGRDGSTRRIRAMPRGSHQFQRPIRRMIDGTSSARITVASKMIPAASPMPNCLMSRLGPVDIEKKANISTSAALVTSFPVRINPREIAFGVEPVSSYASRIRVSMKTS